MEFRVSSAEKRMQIGRMLAPLDAWGNFGKTISDAVDATGGGMTTLTMRSDRSTEEYAGFLDVQIRPSDAFDKFTGIAISTNREVRVSNFKEADGAMKAINLANRLFEPSYSEVDEVIGHFLELAQ